MPYLSEKIPLPRSLDRRVKLTEEDKEDIRKRYKQGEGVREISRAYETKCSRRLIQFVLFPERLEQIVKRKKIEKPWLKYYDREKNTKATRETRNYKQELYLKKLICLKNEKK